MCLGLDISLNTIDEWLRVHSLIWLNDFVFFTLRTYSRWTGNRDYGIWAWRFIIKLWNTSTLSTYRNFSRAFSLIFWPLSADGFSSVVMILNWDRGLNLKSSVIYRLNRHHCNCKGSICSWRSQDGTESPGSGLVLRIVCRKCVCMCTFNSAGSVPHNRNPLSIQYVNVIASKNYT